MLAAATSISDRSARKAPVAIDSAEAMAPARPAVRTACDPPVAPDTPATIPNTAARPSLAPYMAPEIQPPPLTCHFSRPRIRSRRARAPGGAIGGPSPGGGPGLTGGLGRLPPPP